MVGCTQGTFEAFRSLQELWHLTNFTVGHSHLTMYGFITFATWGGVYALLPLATGKAPGQLGLSLHFWMAVVGSFIYVISLSIGGTIQGLDWITACRLSSRWWTSRPTGYGAASAACLGSSATAR